MDRHRKIKPVQLCECGCGQLAKPGNRFINGHNLVLRYKLGTYSVKGKQNPMYGKHHTEKMKTTLRNTLEVRGTNKGENNPFYGGEITKKAWGEGKYSSRPKPHQDWKDKSLEEIYGVEKAKTVKQTMSASRVEAFRKYPKLREIAKETGIKVTDLYRITEFPAQKAENRIKSGLRVGGKGNPAWRGGVSKLPYPFEFDELLKRKIKLRDGYICQLCSCANPKKLGIHHIDYNKLNISNDNLITLCRSCNIKVNTNRNYWTTYFSSIVRRDEVTQSRIQGS